MKAQRLILSIFISTLIALSGTNPALADDSDIYVLPPNFSEQAAPKVLVIFDTSGSMGDTVDASRPDYKSGDDYITAYRAANTGTDLQDGRYYWDSARDGFDVPDAESGNWVSTAKLSCTAATDFFGTSNNTGYFGGDADDLMVQYRNVPSGGDDYWEWRRLSSDDDEIVDCKEDSNASYEQTDRASDKYLDNRTNETAYTNSSGQKYTWSDTGDRYQIRLYSANYIAYYNDNTLLIKRARMRVAKTAIKAVINDNDDVKFGLEAFNQNGSGEPDGGRIVATVGSQTTELEYDDTTLSANAANNDTFIMVDDPRRFSVGERIGIEKNSGTDQYDWTTVLAKVETKLTVTMIKSATTLTVDDASGFADGDAIGITNNFGIIKWRTVSGAPVGDVITISAVLDSGSVDNYAPEGRFAYNGQPVYGRKITLTDPLTGAANAGKTVRARSTRKERLLDTVESLIADGSTPLSESTYEAYRYFAGLAPTFGNPTGSPTPATDLCAQEDDCTDTGDYDSPLEHACEKAYIIMMTDGEPKRDTAEQTYLTAANFPKRPSATGTVIDTSFSSGTNGAGLVPLVEWMNKNDINQDVSETQIGKFYAVTFGDGLSSGAQTLLDNATKAGTGDSSKVATNADDVVDLKEAFEQILGDIKIESASFGAPTLSVNAFNKLYNRDDVYFALFEPSNKSRWNGNLKKFRICTADETGCNSGEIVDMDNNNIIDPTTKRILSSAKSFWGNGTDTDGIKVIEGGVGAITTAMDPDSARRLFTWQGTYPAFGSAALELTPVDDTSGTFFESVDPSSGTPGLPANLGLPPSALTADVTKLVGWMMGKDTYDMDENSSTTTRWAVADPLHSRPIAITYGAQGGDDYTQPIVKLVMGGNDGSIRMFNDSTGEEEWAFIPQEMLDYQAGLASPDDDTHTYGIDNTATVWMQDHNNNGLIETPDSDGKEDKVYLYASMRRGTASGGESYIYALDITPSNETTDKEELGDITPTLLWVIAGGVGAYTQLGQTWSAPQVANITINTGDKTALIFGGGYDTGVENNSTYPAVDDKVVTKNNKGSSGNAIFIADATTGARLWWASNASASDGTSNADLKLADMNYPIPSDLALLDSNGDNAIDRLYVGDVGGQVFRIDLDPEIKPSGANASARNGNTTGYVYADLVCDRASTLTGTPASYARTCGTDDPQQWRRIFYAPDIAGVTDTTYISGGEAERVYDMVFISTGDRPDPLDRLTNSGLSPIEQPVHNAVYGLKDPKYTYGTVASPPRPITPHGATSDVHDATDNLIQGTAGEQTTATEQLRDRKGWMVYFKLSTPPSPVDWTVTDAVGVAEGAGRLWIGEKSLARPVIFGGVVYVTTFVPANSDMTSDSCEPNEGEGWIYALNYLDAKIVIDIDGDDTNDRKKKLGGGIPSELVTVIRKPGTTGLVGSSGGAAQVGVNQIGGQERTFWYQE